MGKTPEVVSEGHEPSFTQAAVVADVEPIVTPKKSPRWLAEVLPLVLVPLHTPVEPLCTPRPARSSSIGFKIEPDQSPVLVVLVVVWPTLLTALTEEVEPIATQLTTEPA